MILSLSKLSIRGAVVIITAPINVIPGEGGVGGRAEGDFDKVFMPEGVAFDFMDLPQGADI